MEELITKFLESCMKEKKLCIILLVIVFSIRSGYFVYLYEFKYVTDESNKKMYVKVIEKQKETSDKTSYLVEFEKSKFIMNIYVDNDNNNKEYYDKNDILQIRGKIIIPETLNNPYEFNYKRYLNSINIVGTISTYSVKKIGVSNSIDFNILNRFRENLLYKAENILEKDEKSLFESMICGVKDYSNNTLREYFRESGSSHFLSISGTHILYFIYVIDIFLTGINKDTKKYIKIILIIMFNFMVGFQISLVRASIMYIVSNISIKGKKINKFYKLFISAMIIILYNPYSIFNVSFIFSFLSIVGITLVLPLINSYLEIVQLKIFRLEYMNEKFLLLSKIKKFIYHIIKHIFNNLAFVISVQVVTLPFQMYFFCEINFITLISNIVLSPLITFELIIGFLSFFFVYVPYISNILLFANKIMLSVIIFSVKALSSNASLKISVIKPDYISIIFYYTIFSIYFFSKYLYKFFKIKKVKKIKKNLKLVTIFFILYIISMYIKTVFFEEYVYFFNVGQGNMALLHKGRTNVVVDLGSTSENLASNTLISFLKAKGIKKIDMIIITHMHDDHINGVEEVIENVKVSKILFSNFEDKNESNNMEFERRIKEKGISVINIGKGDKVLFKDFELEVLSPPQDKVINSNDILNSNSLVFIISKGKYNYLFLGDATKETEAFMFDKNIYEDNIYNKLKTLSAIQIGHHGSKTSTSEILVNKINPCIAIISSKKKKFGHPSKETVEILEKFKFDVKITEQEGAIKIK